MRANMNKSDLRKLMLNRRDSLSSLEVLVKSGKILERLVAMDEYREAGTVLAYMSYRNEVSTDLLIKRCISDGKRVAIPRVERGKSVLNADTAAEKNTAGRCRDCVLKLYELREPGKGIIPGFKGIPEPDPDVLEALEPSEIDMAIIPGVVFDRRRYRIGYGAGCYDRLLARVRPDCVKAGLAFDMQVVDELPIMGHDIPMDYVITESETI